MKKFFLVVGMWLGCLSLTCAGVPACYNVVWNSPSVNSLGSMPLSGRHGAGANVWVEDGSLWIYLAHNGAYDEQGRLLKLGCLRITPRHARLGGTGFSQTLDLASGSIRIAQKGMQISLQFVDQTLLIRSASAKADAWTVSFATWRYQPLKNIVIDMMNARGEFGADHIRADRGGFMFYHRNADHPNDIVGQAAAQGIKGTGVEALTMNRISGGAFAVAGGFSKLDSSLVKWQFWSGKAWSGVTRNGLTQTLSVRLGAGVGAVPSQWQADARMMLRPSVAAKAQKAEQALWNRFWARSYVRVNTTAGTGNDGFLIGRNYQLFRYMLACNRDGELPLLFNGGIFTFDNKTGTITGNNNNELPVDAGEPITPDFRRWMGCSFMSQNERWLGWPNLANGDLDLLMPSVRFYRERAGVAAARAHTVGAEGVVYPEPLDVWGLCKVSPRPDGLCGATHLTYHFSMMLELAWMTLQAHDEYNTDLTKDLGWIMGTVKFYDTFYRAACKKRTGKELGDDGKLVIYPGNGLELAGGATNQIEAVCALHRITGALLTLPMLSAEDRANMKRIYSILPDMPTGQREGKLSLLPARTWENEYNKWEPIEMYAAWPYRMVGVTHPSTLQLARDTWATVPEDRARLCKQDYSWMANLANMAALGLTDEAKKRAIYKMANTAAPQARFPAFFGPGHDWIPDHNWGGSGMTGVQEMLLAADPYGDGKLFLLPAWPTDWDVDFRLHAPRQTVVEASVRHGRVVSLKVTPESRMKDIVLNPHFHK